ncbi:alpha/beta hydrolase fold domain-containing protein, partial [Mycobacterium sp. 1165178.9]|uniref:alpha/beta hydrolase fold domain-containing protein n=1 Tax=Mycobacterium sp. 1165178.9 TaxID=1834070 RepID=UPI000B26C6AD
MTELDGADRLDPALRAVATTRTEFSLAAIQLIREPFNERRRVTAAQTDANGVRIAEDRVPTESGGVQVRIYRCGPQGRAPGVVYCHAGGFALGNLDTDHRQCVELSRRGRCTVVSVDYR